MSIAPAGELETQLRNLVAEALRADPAPVRYIADRIGSTTRTVENWKYGFCGPCAGHLVLLCRRYPALRAEVVRLLSQAA